MDRRYLPYALLAPAVLLTAALVAWPLVETFRLSVTDSSLRPETNYVGFANYIEIFEDDFFEILWRTFFWMFASVTLKIVLGLFGAVLLNATVPGQKLARLLIMPSWIIPIAIGVIMWGWLYNGQFGVISGLLQRIGILDAPFEFLGYKGSAFWSTIVTDVWVGVPMVTLYLLAAMQSIPSDLYEAAWTDGASRWYRFKRVTLPLLIPSLTTMALLSSIFTFNSFDIIWILTEGGPRGGTTTMIIDTYKTAISRNQYGEGAARAVMVLLILSAFTLVYVTLMSRLVGKEEMS